MRHANNINRLAFATVLFALTSACGSDGDTSLGRNMPGATGGSGSQTASDTGGAGASGTINGSGTTTGGGGQSAGTGGGQSAGTGGDAGALGSGGAGAGGGEAPSRMELQQMCEAGCDVEAAADCPEPYDVEACKLTGCALLLAAADCHDEIAAAVECWSRAGSPVECNSSGEGAADKTGCEPEFAATDACFMAVYGD